MQRYMQVTVRAFTDIPKTDRQADDYIVTTGKIMTDVELAAVHGRAWEDVDH